MYRVASLKIFHVYCLDFFFWYGGSLITITTIRSGISALQQVKAEASTSL